MCPAGLQVCRAGVSHALKARSRSDRAWAREVAVGGVPVGVRHGRGETGGHLGNARHGAKGTVRPPEPAAAHPDARGRSVPATARHVPLWRAGRKRAFARARPETARALRSRTAAGKLRPPGARVRTSRRGCARARRAHAPQVCSAAACRAHTRLGTASFYRHAGIKISALFRDTVRAGVSCNAPEAGTSLADKTRGARDAHATQRNTRA